MARSTKIYTVTLVGKICRSFTVRHECVTWLRQQPTRDVHGMMVLNADDNGPKQVWWSALDFIDGAR